MMGTPDYLAPEQALDFHAADIRADLYSLGCTLYYMLTGQPPFPGGTLAQKLLKHQHAEVPPLDTFRADVPTGLFPVLCRMMGKRPADRFQTPLEVATALGALAVGPGQAVAPAPDQRTALPALPVAGGSTVTAPLVRGDPAAGASSTAGRQRLNR